MIRVHETYSLLCLYICVCVHAFDGSQKSREVSLMSSALCDITKGLILYFFQHTCSEYWKRQQFPVKFSRQTHTSLVPCGVVIRRLKAGKIPVQQFLHRVFRQNNLTVRLQPEQRQKRQKDSDNANDFSLSANQECNAAKWDNAAANPVTLWVELLYYRELHGFSPLQTQFPQPVCFSRGFYPKWQIEGEHRPPSFSSSVWCARWSSAGSPPR